LWQSSIRRALSTPRRNDRGSNRFHVPIDASVDQTEARNTAGWAGLTVPAEVLAHYPDLTAVDDPRPLFDTGEDDFRGDRD